MESSASNPAGSEYRQALRKPVKLRAQLRERSITKFTVDVTDLSATGFRCETSFTLWEGHTVFLTLPGFAGQEASVIWRRGYLYGFSFKQPLHPAVFDYIVARSATEQ